ncbi:SOS-response repressor and protease LexA [Castellaniella defragrans 65Phen]|uniref:LexA repressor n=1 Tax=Castellaniella defragrans (strain DSM 12143 / CCUG 39792 / 65Phen) TaxID=1437824 RepID=W8X4A9_CASD6|nr:transcriptional repressor LexA [Castellaniella defragrans]CDM24697.1 SOS-response repressor and protease LexA [Castellaniella defragrans 65Phen]
MALKLTARQSQILDLIRQSIQQAGRPPTRAEIARQLGFRSANAAEDHLRALERKGYIRLSAATSRGIQLTEQARSPDADPAGAPAAARPARDGIPAGAGPAHGLHPPSGTLPGALPGPLPGAPVWLAPSDSRLVPLVGRVAAGSPILAAEHIEREIPLAPHLFESAPDYLLRVRGSSMRDAGILDGDLLAVRSTPQARHGQIVVARLGDDVTVKRLDHQGRRIRLLPENPDFQPIDVGPGDDFAIEGIAVGLIRTTALH